MVKIKDIPLIYRLSDERGQLLLILREMDKEDFSYWTFSTNGCSNINGCQIPQSLHQELKRVVKQRLMQIEKEIENL